MIDQLIINDKASFDDFLASLSSRNIHLPIKKSIKETVPFSNKTYDFSGINGELYWEERELEYVFEIIALTPEELEERKQIFANWIMNVVEAEIHDPFISDYHFIGTFDDFDVDDDDGLNKTTITVKFKAYPYKIANYARTYDFEIPADTTESTVIVNESAHRITPTITTDAVISLKIGNSSYTVSAGETTDDNLKFEVGTTAIILQNSGSTACNVTISFVEEVF